MCVACLSILSALYSHSVHTNPLTLVQESCEEGFKRLDETFIALAVLCDLPYELAAPHSPRWRREKHGDRSHLAECLWFRLLNLNHPHGKRLSDEQRARIVEMVLRPCPRDLQLLLRHAVDEKDREVFSLTDKTTKAAFNSVIFFCGRYEIDWGEQPILISESCIIHNAVDHKAKLLYEATFQSVLAEQPGKHAHSRTCTRTRTHRDREGA